MKKIFTSIVYFAAALLITPVLMAQNLNVPYVVDNGIAFKKSVSPKPDPNTGEYTVKIETFVTGEVATRMKAIPSDILLVLDVSGSMADNYSGEEEYVGITRDWAYNTAFGRTTPRYILYNGEYKQVIHDRHISGYQWGYPIYDYYYLYFEASDGTHYLSGTEIVDECPTTYTTQDTPIYKGTLYQFGVATRLEKLQEAARYFIDLITENDATLELEEGETGNQIGIVKFAGSEVNNIQEGNRSGRTQVLQQFKPVSSSSNVDALVAALYSLQASGATSIDYGLNRADALLSSINTTLPSYNSKGEKVRNKTVVIFTDGEPTHGNEFDNTVARDAVNKAKDIKDNYSATVFTVGVFTATGDTKIKIDNYMEHMSSNYPDGAATLSGNNIVYSGTRLTPGSKCIYYQQASQADPSLADVFAMIATHSSGQNTSVGDESLLTLDIVSSSFSVPEGADLSKVKVYTAQCLGELDETYTDEKGHEHNYLAFAAPVEAKNRPVVAHLWCRRLKTDASGKEPGADGYEETYEWYDKGASVTGGLDIDQNIEKDKSETDNSVSTTGFNFSDYWCGYDENDAARGDNKNTEQYTSSDPNYQYHKPGFRGFKLILEFPITINEDAVGGPSVKTNEPGSGIYLTNDAGEKVGEPLMTFNQPELETPVNLWIKKYGLNKGESATFGIYRRPVSGNSTAWEETPFATVVITGTGEKEGERLVSPVYKMNGLSPKYYYRVEEEGWSWSYNQVASDDDTSRSTETLVVNPVRITDQKKDTSIKHAESKAINFFGKGYGTETIDSREFFKNTTSGTGSGTGTDTGSDAGSGAGK